MLGAGNGGGLTPKERRLVGTSAEALSSEPHLPWHQEGLWVGPSWLERTGGLGQCDPLKSSHEMGMTLFWGAGTLRLLQGPGWRNAS